MKEQRQWIEVGVTLLALANLAFWVSQLSDENISRVRTRPNSVWAFEFAWQLLAFNFLSSITNHGTTKILA